MSKIIRQLHPKSSQDGTAVPQPRDRHTTFKQLRDPTHVPTSVRARLADVGMSDLNPINLFRITWKNDVHTGLYGALTTSSCRRDHRREARIIGSSVLLPDGATRSAPRSAASSRGW